MNKKRVVAMRRKLKKLRKKVDEGKTTEEEVENMFRSWMCGYKSIMSRKQRENLTNLFNELYKEKKKDDGAGETPY